MSGTTFETAQPALIPGYSGYLPQYIFRVGDSYGKVSHKILLDPNINMSERLVLSNRDVDDSMVNRPNDNDIDIVEKRSKYGEVILKHPVIPGYEGTIPGIQGKFGQRFSAEATVALSEFEKSQQKQRQYRQQLQNYKTLQCDEGEPRDLLDKLVQKNKAKLPLNIVRPEAAGIIRSISVPEAAVTKFDNAVSPYFLDPNNKEKYFKLGYAGHIPFGTAHFGASHQHISTASLVDFTNNYRRRLSAEWTPVSASAPDPPLALMPPEIYHKQVGMIPHYMGHLPGAQFRQDFRVGFFSVDVSGIVASMLSGGLGGYKVLSLSAFSSPSLSTDEPSVLLQYAGRIYYGNCALYMSFKVFYVWSFTKPGCGKTFGNDTRDAKRWLRGDFF